MMENNKGYHGHKDKRVRDLEANIERYGTVIEDTKFNLKIQFDGQEGVSMFDINKATTKLEGL